MSYQYIIAENDAQGIFTITINQEKKLNALSAPLLAELSQAIDHARNDAAVKALILTGAGNKAFVAGADITEFLALDVAGGKALAQRGQDEVFSKIEQFPKPVVAAVNGFALGGGCELAMACHLRIASHNAKFGQPEVKLGLIPGYGGTQRLVQLIGKGKAMELLLTADMIDAAEALRLGLVNAVAASSEELLPACKKMLEKIIDKAPIALAQIIDSVNAHFDVSRDGFAAEVAAFGKCFGTADFKEGVTAFLEKRPAVFKGE
ncbi:MAG: enoyl-CoA hydratase/isomerase family protein [Sphingobacteriales bacterium]|nr:enoyl-CoA hydratase/isomerase family protein [Sphingobacteriales bacterium]